MTTSTHRWAAKSTLWAWLVVVGASSAVWAADFKATVVDRNGNRYEVDKTDIQGQKSVEYYIGDKRRIVPFLQIDRFRLEGDVNSELKSVTVFLRSGRSEEGTMFVSGASSPHEDSFGGGQITAHLQGVTELGPFFVLLSDVREVIFRHDQPAPEEKFLKATVIDLEGKRFEVDKFQYEGKTRIDFAQGRKRRSLNMFKMDRIDFAETSTSEEFRPVTFTYKSGKVIQGVVDASITRYAGETDRQFYSRVGAKLTGSLKSGAAFAMGMHQIKLIRFHEPKKAEEAEEGAEKTDESAPAEAAGTN